MEQGREVMAVPGRIDSPNSNGCHQLIKDGAQLIEGIEDVMDALGQVGEILPSPVELRIEFSDGVLLHVPDRCDPSRLQQVITLLRERAC